MIRTFHWLGTWLGKLAGHLVEKSRAAVDLQVETMILPAAGIVHDERDFGGEFTSMFPLFHNR